VLEREALLCPLALSLLHLLAVRLGVCLREELVLLGEVLLLELARDLVELLGLDLVDALGLDLLVEEQ
jgi:hypothetical protein